MLPQAEAADQSADVFLTCPLAIDGVPLTAEVVLGLLIVLHFDARDKKEKNPFAIIICRCNLFHKSFINCLE